MEQRARSPDSPLEQPPTNELASLPLARAYVDALRERISSFVDHELIDALERLDRVYHEFPELVFDRPREELVEGLRSAAKNMPDRAAIPLLMYCVALNPSSSSSVTLLLEKIAGSDGWRSLSPALHLLCRSRELRWCAVKPVINVLRQQNQADKIVQVISEILDGVKFSKKESASDFGDLLTSLLTEKHPLAIGSCALVKAVRSARRRLSQPPLGRPPLGRNQQRSREMLLATAERLKATLSPARCNPRPDLGWPSGRMSFDEFLLQWPCEVELPAELDDAAFIEEAYRAILLRGPDVAETDQYLSLLRNGVVSKPWIIEDLLGSEELRSLERRLRVIWEGHAMTQPGRSADEDMPAVTWPRTSAS
jgi:hypothetical protein